MKKVLLLGAILIISGTSLYAEKDVFYLSTSYKNLLSNPEQNGMLDIILKEAFSRIGLEVEIVFTPTERSLVDVNAGLLDGEINRIEGMEKNYPNLVPVPEPNMTMHFVAFSTKTFEIDGWDSIRDLYIGHVSGWKILEANTAGFPHVVSTPTETELFTMLDKGRIDIALYSKLTGYATLQEMGLHGISHLEPPLASRNMYLYMHKKHANLIHAIAGALREMKEDGTYKQIVTETTKAFVKDDY